MKSVIRSFLSAACWAVFGALIAEVVPGFKGLIPAHPFFAALLLIGIAISWGGLFLLTESPDQRDMKTIVDNVTEVLHLDQQCLTDTNVSRINDVPSLPDLLNAPEHVKSKVVGKRQRRGLAETSCVLQVSFVPVDKFGNTILWKRVPRYHVMQHGTASVLISFSPYSRKFSDVFVLDKNVVPDEDLECYSKSGVQLVDLRDVYSREVENAYSGEFVSVGAYWLPRQKNSRGRYVASAYCFWVFAVRYDEDFREDGAVERLFGRKVNGKMVYLKKDNDKKVEVLPLKELDAYHDAEKLRFGKMDAYVACNYREFLDARGLVSPVK